jgi:hypothetical protein
LPAWPHRLAARLDCEGVQGRTRYPDLRRPELVAKTSGGGHRDKDGTAWGRGGTAVPSAARKGLVKSLKM